MSNNVSNVTNMWKGFKIEDGVIYYKNPIFPDSNNLNGTGLDQPLNWGVYFDEPRFEPGMSENRYFLRLNENPPDVINKYKWLPEPWAFQLRDIEFGSLEEECKIWVNISDKIYFQAMLPKSKVKWSFRVYFPISYQFSSHNLRETPSVRVYGNKRFFVRLNGLMYMSVA